MLKLSKDKAAGGLALKIVFFGLSTLITFGGAYRGGFFEKFQSPNQRLEKTWISDFEKLKSSGRLPKGFSEIKKIDYLPATQNLRLFIEKFSKPKFQSSPKGTYLLEVFLDELEEGGVVIQYDLIDNRGNTVWELGRTFNNIGFRPKLKD